MGKPIVRSAISLVAAVLVVLVASAALRAQPAAAASAVPAASGSAISLPGTLDQAAATTATISNVQATPSTQTIGQTVTLSAQVVPGPGCTITDGVSTLSFSVALKSAGTGVLHYNSAGGFYAASVTYTVPPPPLPGAVVNASYADTGSNCSSPAFNQPIGTLDIVLAGESVTIASDVPTVNIGGTPSIVTLTATVVPQLGCTLTSGDSVSIAWNNVILTAATAGVTSGPTWDAATGKETVTYQPSSAGQQLPATAVYSGNSTCARTFSSNSAIVRVLGRTSVVVSASPNPIVADGATPNLLIATVTPQDGCVIYQDNLEFLVNGAPYVPTSVNPATQQSEVNFYPTSAGSYSITGAYQGNAACQSSSGTSALPAVGPASVTVTASAAPLALNQPAVVTYSITGQNGCTPGATVPTATVTGGGSPAATVDAANHTVTFTPTAGGAITVTVSFPGNSTCAAATGSVQATAGKVPTTTTVAVNPTEVRLGATATLTATVSGCTLASGDTATFSVDSTPLASTGETVSGNQIALPYTPLTVGAHTVSAAFAGSASCQSSSSAASATLTVNKAATTTTVAAQPAPVTVGHAVSLVATVAGCRIASGDPITFSLNGSPLAGAASYDTQHGAITLSYTPLAATGATGAAITVAYGGNGNCLGSSGSLAPNLVVNRAATSTGVQAQPSTAVVGSTTTITATVTAQDGCVLASADTVTFSVNGVAQPPSPLAAGSARLSYAPTSVPTGGSATIAAHYSGNGATCSASDAAPLALTVVGAPTRVSLSVRPSIAIPHGIPLLLIATITPQHGCMLAGADTVTVSSGGTTLATKQLARYTDSQGRLVLIVRYTPTAAGKLELTAAYSGNSTCAASTSSAESATIR